MSPPSDDDQDQFSVDEEEEDDDLFEADMEALRRACMLTGTSPDDLKNDGGGGNDDERQASADSESDSDADDDDLELLRQIRSRFSNSSDACEPLSLKPLCTLPPDASGDEEDDYQTLLAIRKRFSAYGNGMLYRQCICLFVFDAKSLALMNWLILNRCWNQTSSSG